jgi:Fe(3+) dicitrate transport protein
MQVRLTVMASALSMAFSALPAAAQSTTAPQELNTVTVVGDWLGNAQARDVKNHPGVRDVVRKEAIEESGARTVGEMLRRIPGVTAPDNTGGGGSEISQSIGMRGLSPRLTPRSTVLLDGVPLSYMPYAQPQLSFAPISLGNLEAIDIVKGGAAVRYGPQNVGGVINYITKTIPVNYETSVRVSGTGWPAGVNNNPQGHLEVFTGGTAENGFGAALMYSGTRGSNYRPNSDTNIDNLILKYQHFLTDDSELSGRISYYQGKAGLAGGLTEAEYAIDRFQSTRPYDLFEGKRKELVTKYRHELSASQVLEVTHFINQSFRSSDLRSATTATTDTYNSSPRDYKVHGIESRYSQAFRTGSVDHEVSVGHRFLKETGHQVAVRRTVATGGDPSTATPTFRTPSDMETWANALYVDDRIEFGKWAVTPGVRVEDVRMHFTNNAGTEKNMSVREPLPSINVLYKYSPSLNLFGNVNTSYGSIQQTALTVVQPGVDLRPEKARTEELGVRYGADGLEAELALFHIDFSNQIVTTRTSATNQGATTHRGLETSIAYDLGKLSGALAGFSTYATYAYTSAKRDEGANAGRDLPNYSRHVATLGARYQTGPWAFNLDGYGQSKQVSYNESAAFDGATSADGRIGAVPGFGYWNVRVARELGDQARPLQLAVGVKNVFDKEYFFRSTDTNGGKYVGAPRAIYAELSARF